MTVQELMENIAIDPNLEGIATADDMVFAIDFASNLTDDPLAFLVAQLGISEVSGAISGQSQSATYLRAGEVTTKTGTSKAFTLSGDRYRMDAFQEALLDHDLKWGRGVAVVKPYVYFDMLTGKGERGKVAITIEGDLANGAGSNGGISGTLNVQGTPSVYTYTPPVVP